MIHHYRKILVNSGFFTKNINISDFEIIDLGAFFENASVFSSH